ncbi:MAG: hypothetical protein ACK559_03130, partial [bacterium]
NKGEISRLKGELESIKKSNDSRVDSLIRIGNKRFSALEQKDLRDPKIRELPNEPVKPKTPVKIAEPERPERPERVIRKHKKPIIVEKPFKYKITGDARLPEGYK